MADDDPHHPHGIRLGARLPAGAGRVGRDLVWPRAGNSGGPRGAAVECADVVVGDLFSGIGGFSLAAHWMGWRTAWFSEIDPYASRVLAKHWPDVPNLGDITKVRWEDQPPVDVVTAGFPCQPHSVAGKRLASNDERDLFDEIIRCLRVVRPRYAVLENVPGLFTSESGRFFGRVLGALAACGYDAEWRVLSAADVGAPHLRERAWIIAYAKCERSQFGAACGLGSKEGNGIYHVESNRSRRESGWSLFKSWPAGSTDTPDTGSSRGTRLESSGGVGSVRPWRLCGPEDLQQLTANPFRDGPSWPQPLIRRMDDGVPARVDRLRCLGNAIVPQCAYEIFRSINTGERMTQERAA
ncbi:cytosine specific methyltransferase [Caudoviricetes sp.]|nr:cytosine specific methyltransferase [Caudoviricetes sp.]